MRIPENLCMLLPKALKMRAIKNTMALVADSIGGTKCAPAQMLVAPEASQTCPAQPARNDHPPENGKMDLSLVTGPKGQLKVGLCVGPVRPCKPPQLAAKLGTLRGSTTR